MLYNIGSPNTTNNDVVILKSHQHQPKSKKKGFQKFILIAHLMPHKMEEFQDDITESFRKYILKHYESYMNKYGFKYHSINYMISNDVTFEHYFYRERHKDIITYKIINMD